MSARRREQVATHPIDIVSERTGLSPEVLRIWERRYRVVQPSRAEGGQRLYTDADIERLKLLRQAAQGGRGIGRVADLTVDELAELIREDVEPKSEKAAVESVGKASSIDHAIGLAREMDAERLEDLLRRTATLEGAPRFMAETVAPFLQRIGAEWQAGQLSVSSEHLATAIANRVVVSVLDALRPAESAPTLLVAGPAGDRHEMGALLASAIAASEGWRVAYMGPDLPAAEVAGAARAIGVAAVGLSVVFVESRDRTLSELTAVRDLLPPSVPLLVGGRGADELSNDLQHPGIRVIQDLELFRQTLRELERSPVSL